MDPLYTEVLPTNKASLGERLSHVEGSVDQNHPMNSTIREDGSAQKSAEMEPDTALRTTESPLGKVKSPSKAKPSLARKGPYTRQSTSKMNSLSSSPSRTAKRKSTKGAAKGRTSLFQALLKSGQEQFPYSMRFVSQGTQCNLITRAKIINDYQDEIRVLIED